MSKLLRSCIGSALLCALVAGAHAQAALCQRMLEGGLYSNFKFTDTGNFDQDFKTYLFSSQFKEDLKNNKWGGSITVPIEGVPVSLGANASDAEVSRFRSQISTASSFTISSDYRKTLVSSIPNVDLAKAYSDCLVRVTNAPGFHVVSSSGDTWANFVVTYTKQVSSDPMPVVSHFEVRNGAHVSTTLSDGAAMTDATNVTADRDPSKDLLLFIQTDRGVVSESIPADLQLVVGSGVPIGSVISSVLEPDKFYVATAANEHSPGNVWTSSKSKWAPADGRAVPGSQFEKIASVSYVPDLRGMFVRGLDVMDHTPPVPLDPNHRDPDTTRTVGTYQADAFKKHSHQYREWHWTVPTGNGPYGDGLTANPGNHPLETTENDPGDPNETRPQNIALYYYIRIN